jgi:hypothetical protein
MDIVRSCGFSILLGALSLAACATHPGRPQAPDGAVAAARPAMQATNEGSDWLDFYLIGEAREWYLGRVAAGGKAWLRLPADFPRDRRGTLRLAVVAGAQRSLQAERDPRAVVTGQQSLEALLGQHWTFAHRQLTGLRPHAAPPPRTGAM